MTDEHRVLPATIVLVGPMGAGKSTVGKALAKLLGYRFIDSDVEIEARAGADIPWIFDVEGEEGFRQREQHVLEELCALSGIVLATGGGAVLREANRALIQQAGWVVYLKTSVREQVRRTGQDSKRPLLVGKDREKVLQDLMIMRDPLYTEVAHKVINAEGKNPKRVASAIYDALMAGDDASI
jgi:shikimate kinase